MMDAHTKSEDTMNKTHAVLTEKIMGEATRAAYGDALVELGREYPEIVVLDADLASSTQTGRFAKAFPERFFNMGIQEANMAGYASGLARCGHIPFISSFSVFLLCKAFDQLRVGVAFMKTNVKVVTTHGGISIGEDGPSQQAVEDVGLACLLPGFVVVVPCDEVSMKRLVRAAVEHQGPVWIRAGRPKTPLVYNPEVEHVFELGKANTLLPGEDATICANGMMVAEAIQAHMILKEMGIHARVIDCHTVKPLDEQAIEKAARETGALVVVEEHLTHGGLGGAVSRAVNAACPVPMEFIGIEDTYAESGGPFELLEKYGLTADNIVESVQRVLKRK